MYNRIDAKSIEDITLPMSRRGARGVYFVRVCGWDNQVRDRVWDFHEAALRRGVIIEGQITNPDSRQMSYLGDVLGTTFEPGEAFLLRSLEKWMPRMSEANRREFARAMCVQLDELRRMGKTESICKNLYFKIMCWLYYRFERLMPLLGEDDPPRILYETQGVTAHELTMLRLLSAMGADILLLEPGGDAAYRKQDPQSAHSQLLVPEGKPFPKDFSLRQLRREKTAEIAGQARARSAQTSKPSAALPGSAAHKPRAPAATLKPVPSAKPAAPVKPSLPAKPAASVDPIKYFKAPAQKACTNAWMDQADYNQILTPVVKRGEDPDLFYNAFVRAKGVPDKTTYVHELHQFYRRFQSTGRKLCVVDGGLAMPGTDEIETIRRRNYKSAGEMIVDLAGNLPGSASVELQKLMQRAFVMTMQDAQKAEPVLQRLLNAAVYLLCWIKRYHGRLFQGYRDGDVPCFVLMGGCASGTDALYPLFLSRLPVDVLIFAPDLNRPCALRDDRLLELTGADSLPLMKFPRDTASLQMDTLASHAQNDLTDVLYTDSGLYRNHQFSKGEALTLRTTYDELFILWNQELKYRTGFSTVDQQATMPVVYAKICGVEEGKRDAYWQKLKLLVDGDTYFVPRLPMLTPGIPNEYMALAVKCVRNNRLKRKEILADKRYPLGILREEMQEHILDKVQLMLDRRLIRGTFENGTEYTILSTVLNMDKALLRLLQSFDFTKRNPKLVCVCTDDKGASLEDAILITFLNLVGFDIALFVPTGYQVIERHLNDNYPVEHQIGEYLYDLTVPDLNALPPPKKLSILTHLFKRGN